MAVNYNIMNIISEKYVENKLKDKLKNIYCFVYENGYDPLFFKAESDKDAVLQLMKMDYRVRYHYIKKWKRIYRGKLKDEVYTYDKYMINDISKLDNEATYEELVKYIKISELIDNHYERFLDLGYLENISSELVGLL